MPLPPGPVPENASQTSMTSNLPSTSIARITRPADQTKDLQEAVTVLRNEVSIEKCEGVSEEDVENFELFTDAVLGEATTLAGLDFHKRPNSTDLAMIKSRDGCRLPVRTVMKAFMDQEVRFSPLFR